MSQVKNWNKIVIIKLFFFLPYSCHEERTLNVLNILMFLPTLNVGKDDGMLIVEEQKY